MANSLCFGLMFSTVLVLFLVPCFYLLYARLVGRGDRGDADSGEGSRLAPRSGVETVDQVPVASGV